MAWEMIGKQGIDPRRTLFVTPILHPQLFDIFVGSFLFHIIDECFPELSLEDLPTGHAEGKDRRVLLYFSKPFGLEFYPSAYIRSSNQGKEVSASLRRVFRDVGVVVHEHKAYEFFQEVEGPASISIEVIRRVSCKTRAFFRCIVVEVGKGIRIIASASRRASSTASSPMFCRREQVPGIWFVIVIVLILVVGSWE